MSKKYSSSQHEYFIKHTLKLARKGLGYVSPNPLVGAVLVSEGQIIAEGYHHKYGEAHAEIDCLRNLRSIPQNSTLYVNLEPCSHYGKTPPCADAIINYGIKNVVIGALDPNPLVAGKGVKKLIDAGVRVLYNILEEDCKDFNKFFYKNIVSKTPYITIKIAQSINGCIADYEFASKWITNEFSRKETHKLRFQYDAIMVGAGTVNADSPKLDVRSVKGRNPHKIVLSPKLNVTINPELFKSKNGERLFIITSEELINSEKGVMLKSKGAILIPLPENKLTKHGFQIALNEISKYNIASILVEGGAKTASFLIENSFVDELVLFTAPIIIAGGVNWSNALLRQKIENKLVLQLVTHKKLGSDLLSVYKFSKEESNLCLPE